MSDGAAPERGDHRRRTRYVVVIRRDYDGSRMAESEILLVDDDPDILEILRQGFEQSGHTVRLASDGAEAVFAAQRHRFRVMVLDVMLPVYDGVQVTTELRRRGNSTPILMLTARGFADDVVRGLDAGAEDYMSKPFSFLELLARVRRLMRHHPGHAARYRVADLELDPEAHRVVRGTREIVLSRTQFMMLETLMRRSGQVVKRRDLIDSVWGAGTHVEPNTVDVAMRALRSAVDRHEHRALIHTVRGFGYCLDER